MKKYNLGLYFGILASLFAAVATSHAGIFTNLHAFVDGSVNDGSQPNDATLINGALFGSTSQGGASNLGLIYTVGTNSAGYASIHDFGGASATPPDGEQPNEILQAGNIIYGTTYRGGTNSGGTVYKMNTNGSGYVILRSFTSSPDAQFPFGGLVISGNTLYGTSLNGGAFGQGSVFKIDTSGANFTILHDFTNNPDGSNPRGRLLLIGSTLYGVTAGGGTNTDGTIFKINTDGSGYSVIAQCADAPAATTPYAGLSFDNNALYGVSTAGGTGSAGTVFRLGFNGAGFTVIHSFTNSEGLSPQGALLVTNNLLYGTTLSSGTGGGGTVFQLGTNGANFTVLKNFTNALTGVNPKGQLVLSGNTLYGVANYGGPNTGGTVYRLVLAPVINTQPQNQSVPSGSSASFSVGAADEFPMTYQWYLNTTTQLGGQTASTLNIASVNNGNTGNYTVVVSDNVGSVTSSPASLTIASTPTVPVITGQPQSLTRNVGTSASFTVTATSNAGSPTYQWYYNTNTLLNGQTGGTLTLPSVTNSDAGAYTVVVGNTIGSVTSSPALLTVVNPPPTITAQPQSLTVTNGNPASFSVTATTVTGTLLYQWYFNTNTPLAGQTNSTYTIPVTFTNYAGYYTVAVANNGGAVTSTAALLTVSTNSKPVISDQNHDLYITNGDTANFFVVASGKGPLQYQWYTNKVNNLATYSPFLLKTNSTLPTTATTNKNIYFVCVVTNSLGKATSSPAFLNVVTIPVILTNPQPVTVGLGNTATFSVTALATTSFQWYSNSVNTAIGTAIAGQTAGTYSLTGTATDNGKYYSVVAISSLGKATSSPALLTVVSLPAITLQPVGATITNGSPVTFTSAAAGPGTLNYQWLYQTNQPINGATSTSLTFAHANQPGAYSMMASNNSGAVTSTPALLNVVGRPIILSSSFDPASGSYSFSYVNLAGSTNRLWATANLADANAWLVIATNFMATNGIWQVTDPNTAQTNNIRLYRFSSP